MAVNVKINKKQALCSMKTFGKHGFLQGIYMSLNEVKPKRQKIRQHKPNLLKRWG